LPQCRQELVHHLEIDDIERRTRERDAGKLKVYFNRDAIRRSCWIRR